MVLLDSEGPKLREVVAELRKLGPNMPLFQRTPF
jgi:hypothetical protein